MEKLIKMFNQLDKVLLTISSVTMFILMTLISTDVVLRTVFNKPIPGTLELTGEYLMVIIVYFAVSYTYKDDGHVRVAILENVFNDTFKIIIKFLSNIVVAVFFLFISYFSFLSSLENLEFNIRSIGALDYPLAPAIMIISFGMLMIALRLILENIQLVLVKKEESNLSTDDIDNVV